MSVMSNKDQAKTAQFNFNMAPLKHEQSNQSASAFLTPKSNSRSPNNRYVEKKIVFLKKPIPSGKNNNEFELPQESVISEIAESENYELNEETPRPEQVYLNKAQIQNKKNSSMGISDGYISPRSSIVNNNKLTIKKRQTMRPIRDDKVNSLREELAKGIKKMITKEFENQNKRDKKKKRKTTVMSNSGSLATSLPSSKINPETLFQVNTDKKRKKYYAPQGTFFKSRGINLLRNHFENGRLRQTQTFVMSNQYNELTLAQQILKKQAELQAEALKNDFLGDIERQKKRRKANLKKLQSSSVNVLDPQQDNDLESNLHDPFYEHWDIDQVIPNRCISAVCNKLRYQKFMMRQIPQQALQLQEFINYEINGKKKTKVKALNIDKQLIDIDIIKDWMDIKQQIPFQNFLNCYGITQIKENYYMISDLIQDNKLLPSQRAEMQRKMTIECKTIEQYEAFQNEIYIDSQKGNKGSNTSQNMYQLIGSANLGNLSALPMIPKEYIKMILAYIIQISRAFSHTHQNGLIHGNFNLSKVIAQQFSQGFKQNSGMGSNQHKQSGKEPLDNIDIYNFFLVNFEPWQVQLLIQKQKDDDSIFKDIIKHTSQFQLQTEDFKQILKIQDLQAFGNSIIEVIVGKSEQTDFRNRADNEKFTKITRGLSKDKQILERVNSELENKQGFKPITGGIQLDAIPLNWSKCKETSKIINIIHKCLGPYGFNNNIQKVETDMVFKEIHQMALDTFINSFGQFQDNFTVQKQENQSKFQDLRLLESQNLKYEQRLKSSVLNNQGVMLYLSITNEMPLEQQETQLLRIQEIFQEAINISENNAVALLNSYLLQWSLGQIKDEQFQNKLGFQLNKIEPELSRLMYILFKKYVQCHSIQEQEVNETIKMIKKSKKVMSNLTKYLFDHHEFMDHKVKYNIKLEKEVLKQNQESLLMKQIQQVDNHPHKNLLINIGKTFKLKEIAFSNNDYHVGLVGKDQIWIIDSRNGKINHIQDLPRSQEFTDITLQRRLPGDKDYIKDKKRQRVEPNSSSNLAEQETFFFRMQTIYKNLNNIDESAEEYQDQDDFLEGGDEQPKVGQSLEIKHQRGFSDLSHQNSGLNTGYTSQARLGDKSKETQSRDSKSVNLISRMGGMSQIQTPQESIRDSKQVEKASDLYQQESQRNKLKTNMDKINIKVQVESEQETTSELSEDFSSQTSPNSYSSSCEYFGTDDSIYHEQKQKALEERNELNELYPSEWQVDIRNSGKMLALFDKSQYVRNKHWKHPKFNFCEVMYIYNINTMNKGITSQGSQEDEKDKSKSDNIYKLDMSQLLGDNEVLNFGFDDFNESFSTITVQAKDLYVYQIDFINQKVIRKTQERHNVMMKSIFYNMNGFKSKHRDQQQIIKEFIQEQESFGNKVLLPKLNEDIIIIGVANTSDFKVYSIQHRRFIRQFTLETKQSFPGGYQKMFTSALINQIRIKSLENNYKDDQEQQSYQRATTLGSPIKSSKTKLSSKQLKLKKLPSSANQTVPTQDQVSYVENKFMEDYLGKESQLSDKFKLNRGVSSDSNILNNMILKLAKNKSSINAPLKSVPEYRKKVKDNSNQSETSEEQLPSDQQQKQKIGLLEVSPQGKYLVAELDDYIFIKVIHLTLQAEKEKQKNYFDYQQTITFMPIYQDQDYNYNTNEFELESKSCENPLHHHRIEKSNDSPLTAGLIDKTQQMYTDFLKMGKGDGVSAIRSQYVGNLFKFVDHFIQNPKLTFDFPLRQKTKYNKLEKIFNLARNYSTMDPKNVSLQKYRGTNFFHIFDDINFGRSFEEIKCIALTTNIQKCYVAIIISRKLQVYNYISGKMMFEVNMPNAGAINPLQSNQQQCMFLDEDNILAVRDGNSRFQLFIVNAMEEDYARMHVKEKKKNIVLKNTMNAGDQINEKFHIYEKSQDENSSENELGLEAQTTSQRELIYEEQFEYIFSSRNCCKLGYMAMLNAQRFKIYNIYDDGMSQIDCSEVWDNDIRFNREIRNYGKMISLDFENECKTFITGTNLGWIVVWDLLKKCKLKQLQVVYNEKPDHCNLIRDFQNELLIAVYSNKTMNLYVTKYLEKSIEVKNITVQIKIESITKILDKQNRYMRNKVLNHEKILPEKKIIDLQIQMRELKGIKKQINIVKTQVPINIIENMSDSQKNQMGVATQIQIDSFQSNLFVAFKYSYIMVFDVKGSKEITQIQILGPFSNSPNPCPIFIDDYCTYMAHLDDSSKMIKYHLFDYEYKCSTKEIKIEKALVFKDLPEPTILTEQQMKETMKYTVVNPKQTIVDNMMNVVHELVVEPGEQNQSKFCSIF